MTRVSDAALRQYIEYPRGGVPWVGDLQAMACELLAAREVVEAAREICTGDEPDLWAALERYDAGGE